MANNNQIYKMSNAGGFKSLTRYYDMLAGNTTWNPWSPTGAYDSIATVTVGSGGASSITFNSIPSTYKHLQIRGIAQESGSQISLRFNGDTGANYSFHNLSGFGTVAAGAGTSQSQIFLNFYVAVSPSAPFAFIIDVLDYADTNKYKTLRSLNGTDLNGDGVVELVSGSWRNTAAINSITIYDSGANLGQYSTFALYGVK